MDNREIFKTLAEVTMDSVDGISSWTKACLYVRRSLGHTAFESSYFDLHGNEFMVDTHTSFTTHKAIQKLYINTQNGLVLHKNWNKAVFTLYPDSRFEINYTWDQAMEDEINAHNMD